MTGASRGIGLAIAKLLLSWGAKVAGTATTLEGARAVEESLSGEGMGIVLDVRRRSQADAAVDAVLERWGRLDVLVNNAGVVKDDLLLRMDEASWQEVLDTDLTGVFIMCQAALKPMLKARFGRIVNIASVVASMGNAGQTNYCAAKAGVLGFSKALAREVGKRGITVNCVAPGFIETDMTKGLSAKTQETLLAQVPLGRLGRPEDVAWAVGLLCAPRSSYITGETVHVNGGLWMGG